MELSQRNLAAALGGDWRAEYYVWDCAAGMGNLLPGYVFQFDFLNDEFGSGKLPASLQRIIRNEELRERLVAYINPPYAEVGKMRALASGICASQ